MNWVVIQGTPAETDPVVPEYVSGDIQAGDTVADMPMYKVHLDGLNITSIEKVFTVVNGLKELNSNNPFCVTFDVPAFLATEGSKKITVELPRTMPDTNYTWVLQCQSFVSFSSETWMTGKVTSKATTSANVIIFNEQDHAIGATTWGLFIFP